MKIILCGYNWAGCKALELLLEKEHQVFVFSHTSPYYVNDLEIFCKKRKVGYSLDKIDLKRLPFKPDIIVSIYYRHIIPQEVIQSCNNKIFNLHPSLLPQYKGCSSLTWAMINGESKTGYTYHYIHEGIDTGRIILQKEISIEEFDTQISLYFRVMFEALKDFNFVLDMVFNGFAGYPQDNNKGNYFKRGCPQNGVINENWGEEFTERFIRAMIYPPLPVAEFKNQKIYSFDQFLRRENSQ